MIGLDLLLFVFLGLFSPGPNVILLASSGAQFGTRATIPHLCGVVIGVGIIGCVVGFGVGAILFALPQLTNLLRVIATAWIVLLAYQLWVGADPKTVDSTRKPMRFDQAVLFQWVNPKVWAVAIAAAALLGAMPLIYQGLVLGLVMSGVNLFVCSFWTGFGHMLGRFLSAGAARRRFLRVMAILLAMSGLMVWINV